MHSAEYFIESLGLEFHIEGGYFKVTYRCTTHIDYNSYPTNFEGERALSTTINFLLKSGQTSKFHTLKFDEIWFYHYGSPMVIHMIDSEGVYSKQLLGINLDKGENPQVLVPANTIFGAEPLEKTSFGLVSFLVSPGFDCRDFTLFTANELITRFPKHKNIITRING